MKRIRIALIQICLLAPYSLTAQEHHITYTASFTRSLEKAGIELYEPVESWLHVAPEPKDDIMECDLVLQNDRNDFEVRYRIRRIRNNYLEVPQHVEANRLLASIASNSPDAEIKMNIPDSIYLHSTFNADAGMFAEFIPKLAFSEKPYGTFISLYADEQAAIDVILLYYDPQYSALDAFKHVRFK